MTDTVEPVVPTQPLPKKTSLLPILLFLLIILLLSSTAYLAYQNMQLTKQIAELSKPVPIITPSPTPNPISNWKTYNNANVGFSIMYPPDWVETEDHNGGNPAVTSKTVDIIALTKGATSIKIYSGAQIDFSYPQETLINTDQIKIGQYLVTKQTYTLTNQKQYTNVIKLLFQKAPVYRLEALYPSTEELTINQILSTFKFISNEDQSGGQPCGGIAGLKCNPGDTCQLNGSYPDASGTCVTTVTYTCPPSGYVDCMPILDAAKKIACSPEAMAWYKANCPDFKGGAL